MPDDDRLQELFRRWQDARRLGRSVSAEELSRDFPELTEALRQRIADHSVYLPPATIVELPELPPPPAPPPPPPEPALFESIHFLDLAPGREPVLGYRLVSMLGRGSFGQVWKAIGPGGFAVALKCVPLGGTADASEVRALEVMKDIRHANILAMFGAWQTSDFLVIAMELADDTLLDRCNQCRKQGNVGIPREELLEYLRDAAKGIDYLNEPTHTWQGQEGVGIQHRDIKPQNLLRVGGSVKVADFGLAKILQHSGGSNSGSMTAAYAAPECFKGQTSHRSDQYSLAVTYCQMRGGRLPFAGQSMSEIMLGHVHRPPDLSMLPMEEQPPVARALAKDPDQRWPSCRAFVAALSEVVPASSEFKMIEAMDLDPEPAPEYLSARTGDSLPTLTPATVPQDWQEPLPARPRGRWMAALLLGGLAAVVGGVALGVLVTLLPRPEEHAVTTRPDEPRPVAPRPTEPTPPVKLTMKATEPIKPPPDPEKEKREQAVAQAKLGQEAMAQKEPNRAIPFFTKAIVLDPGNAGYYFQRGQAQFDVQKYDKAIDDLTEAIKRDDNNGIAFALRGRAQAELKHPDRAIEDFDRAISLGQRDASVYTSRGTAHANCKDYSKALEDFEAALKLNPSGVLTLYNRGVVYEKQGKHEKAVVDFTAAVKLDEKYVRAYASRGRAYARLKRREDALADYDTALKLDPNYVWAYNARGYLYHDQFKDDELAIRDFTKAIALDPSYAPAYENRAAAYERLKDTKRAREDRQKAEELAKKMPTEPSP